jgi:hypothetical protein
MKKTGCTPRMKEHRVFSEKPWLRQYLILSTSQVSRLCLESFERNTDNFLCEILLRLSRIL